MRNATTVTVTAAVLSACYSNCSMGADALQSSPSFPQTPRGHNIAQGYFDEGHPFSYDPTNFDSSSIDFSEQMQSTDGSTNGMQSPVLAPIDTINNVHSDYTWQFGPEAQTEERDVAPERQHISKVRRRSRLAPRPMSASILSTRRKKRTTRGRVGDAPSSPDLLTFEEEKEIAGDIRRFRSVTQARDNLSDWMARGGNPHGGISEYQWASACSLSVDQLHDVMARGQEARTRLIKGNVGLVTMIAKRYHTMLRGGGMGHSSGGEAGGTDATLKLDDLIQEGYMGIMEAAERFDPTKGFRFSTYATHWIRQRIVRSIAESSRMIRLPVHVQTLIRNMHKTNKEMEMRTGRRPSTPELAHEMGLPLDKIQLYQHLTKNVLSLELPVDRHSNTEDKRTLGDRVACTEFSTPDEDFMSESLRGEVHAMLGALGHDERLVLTHRFGLEDGRPKSLRETAEGMGVSSDIVRTVEAKALNKLRQPRMNYRLKDYVGGSESYCEHSEHAESHNWGMLDGHNGNMMPNNVEQQQQQHYYHYPHHMNGNMASSNTNDNVRDDDLGEYERPTPESIWSF